MTDPLAVIQPVLARGFAETLAEHKAVIEAAQRLTGNVEVNGVELSPQMQILYGVSRELLQSTRK